MRKNTSTLLCTILLLSFHEGISDPCAIDGGTIIGQLDNPILNEVSGIVESKSQGVLWVLNDHGAEPSVYAISPEGDLMTTVNLVGKANNDWEDLALHTINGVNLLYIGDIGNNDFIRDDLKIFRLREPNLENEQTIDVPESEIERLEIEYPDANYDSEALTVDPMTGDIFLFTKDRENTISHVYRYPAPQSFLENKFVLEYVTTLPCFWVTGGDISPDGKYLALTNKQFGYGFELPDDMTWFEYLSTGPEPCVIEFQDEVQRESIGLTNLGIWTTSECKDDPPCPIWYYERL